MFTGIIEEIGHMRRIHSVGQAMVLTIGAKKILEDVHLGDSISVNGVCLTVISFDNESFSVDVMPETYRKTNLRKLQAGTRVNLERAMAANGRFGGHIVQGHVDSTATIISRIPEENAVVYRFEPEDKHIFRYIIAGGSITIDGISLTVVDVTERDLAVSIIPHTLAQTVLHDKKAGDTINMECDVLGKYMERLLKFGPADASAGNSKKQSTLSASFLADHGFM
ncbi:riboflavin synthase [Paenibacillus chondroitinus]|uniref:Riboflavin synthase n=1 Tax=Paenibacillus chondroitinus TaxID=59842 RepID=A0ABU6DM06_9BACL|nr:MULTISPECIES: riboflavin synthase [Paenibacillus]MCY9657067.1 riboflavin synthase [Paenibacillus anseongense]MEB4798350.1 riboflavin synthase [Paenibacillus chondroitinus]